MNFQSEKQADTLKLQGIIELFASSLMDIKSDFTLDLSRYEYQALNQLSEYYLETQAPELKRQSSLPFWAAFPAF